MGADYVDVQPDAVMTAGRATAGTSTDWSAWASRTENLLREAATDALESQVTGAIEDHLASWNPRMQGLATNADALGTNAVSATKVMLSSDSTATSVLGRQATLEQANASMLLRPINP